MRARARAEEGGGGGEDIYAADGAKGGSNPSRSHAFPRVRACIARAAPRARFCAARARLPRNDFHLRFPAARLRWAICTHRAMPNTGSGQPNLQNLHPTGQVGPYAPNQTRPG
jgi:hypothetical protein